jgi:myo-inositol-1(or 4)-monophosphatase
MSYLDTAVSAARQAGDVLRRQVGSALVINESAGHDIKLALDVESEALIRAVIQRAYPDHAILGEEEGGEIAQDTPTWIVDPLDGTVNYAHGLAYFAVSIALTIAGEAVVGVVYDPLRDELFSAERGEGARLNGRPMQVSRTRERAEALVCMGFPKMNENIDRVLTEMRALAHHIKKVRILGAAALDLAYVAAGRLEGFAEYGLRTWDIAAGALLIREAGGRFVSSSAGEHAWNVHADNGYVFDLA